MDSGRLFHSLRQPLHANSCCLYIQRCLYIAPRLPLLYQWQCIRLLAPQVEKIVPQYAPEGSSWRKTKITTPAAGAGEPIEVKYWCVRCFYHDNHAVMRILHAKRHRLTTGGKQVTKQSPPRVICMRCYGWRCFAFCAAAATGTPNPLCTLATSDPPVMLPRRCRFEIQRSGWHAKLGNLVLLQPHAPRGAHHGTADYDEKAEFYVRSGSHALFPRFTGGLVGSSGRYGGTMFSFEACRQRHGDLLDVLCDAYGLKAAGAAAGEAAEAAELAEVDAM